MNCLRSFRCFPSFLVSAPKPRALNLIRPLHSSSFLRSLDMETVHTTDRLRELRSLMKKHEVDIYSTDFFIHIVCRSLTRTQLFPRKTATNQSTLRRVTLVEVRLTCSVQRLVRLTMVFRIHNWLLWIRRHCSHHARQSISCHGWALFQSSQQATRRELGAAQARLTGCSDLAGVVRLSHD